MYQRITSVNAVQFKEEEFLKDPLSYPDVLDKAMFDKSWLEKKSDNGRYFLFNQPNAGSTNEYIAVNEGDYIIREDMGITHTLPKEIFEQNHILIAEK